MINRPERTNLGEGVAFTHIADSKFKHNRISISFIMPLSKETASENAVLPFLLRRGCKSCPDFTSLNERLCELYGASLDGAVSKYNGYHILSVSVRGIDNRYALDGEDIVGACAALLADIVLEPNFDEAGLFREEDLALERQYLIDTIESEINDKRTYALQQCISAMCQGEPVAVRRYGTVEDARAITVQSATAAWRRLIQTARIEITFTGPGNPEAAQNLFRQRLAEVQRRPHGQGLITLRDRAEQMQEKTEEMPLHQSKLVIGMRVAGIHSQQDAVAARVFSALFGGTPFSKLFLNVREKLSLCYYCSSYFDASNRLLFVDSGVEPDNKQLAQEEILRQLEAVRQGDFTETELANTKLLLKNSIRSVTDSLSSLESWYLTYALRGLNYTPAEDCAMIDGITGEAVRQIANAITLDTIYFLTKGGDVDDAESE